MTTRRTLVGAALAALAIPGQTTAEEASGHDDFVLMNTNRRGWHIHRGMISDDPSEDTSTVVRIPHVTIGCDTKGTWWMGVATADMDLPAHIELDTPDAVSFLRTFTSILLNPPDEMPVRHTLSELREAGAVR